MACHHYQYPAINLRMKWSSYYERGHQDGPCDLPFLTDQVDAMVRIGRSYECGDYLQQPLHTPPPQDDLAMDSLARKKMIDWKFRVVDHYGISRETVAASTNLMDRFASQCPCDRMGFKLAAMTSLYMAAKIHDHAQLPLSKLVELSRGEFYASDVVEMESLILKTLSWRVNPVTVHSFIQSLVRLVPVSNPTVVAAVYDRAIFFAELCLFDYSYVTRSRSTIAVAAVLNALEGIGEGLTTQDAEQAFMETLQVNTCVDLSWSELERLREDLWYVYSMSAQYQEDDMQMFPSQMSTEYEKQHPTVVEHNVAYSPVSVLGRKNSY